MLDRRNLACQMDWSNFMRFEEEEEKKTPTTAKRWSSTRKKRIDPITVSGSISISLNLHSVHILFSASILFFFCLEAHFALFTLMIIMMWFKSPESSVCKYWKSHWIEWQQKWLQTHTHTRTLAHMPHKYEAVRYFICSSFARMCNDNDVDIDVDVNRDEKWNFNETTSY